MRCERREWYGWFERAQDAATCVCALPAVVSESASCTAPPSSHVAPVCSGGETSARIWGGFDAYCRFSALKPFFLAAIHTGLRRGDLMDLRWTDVRCTQRRK